MRKRTRLLRAESWSQNRTPLAYMQGRDSEPDNGQTVQVDPTRGKALTVSATEGLRFRELVKASATSLNSIPHICELYRSFDQAPNKPAEECEPPCEQCGPETKPRPRNT